MGAPLSGDSATLFENFRIVPHAVDKPDCKAFQILVMKALHFISDLNC
jgi:hypothetical protein